MENCLLETKSTGGVSCLPSVVWLAGLKCCQYFIGQQGNSVYSMLTSRTLPYTGDAKKKGLVPYHPEELWSSKNFNLFVNLGYPFFKEITTLFQNRGSSHCNKLASAGLT